MTMNLSLTASLASNYHSQRQVARVMTESWLGWKQYVLSTLWKPYH